MDKICPIHPFRNDDATMCCGNKCAWWVDPETLNPYTGERLPSGGMCSVRMVAMNDSTSVLVGKYGD